MNFHLSKALTFFALVVAAAPSHSQTQRFNVEENWPAYQNFLRDRDTRFFADDGVVWDAFQLELVRGVKNPDGSCTMDMSRTARPGERLSSSKTLNVAQAVNQRTCETLFKRGKAVLRDRGNILPQSILSFSQQNAGNDMPPSSDSARAVAATADVPEGVGYKHAARLYYRWDDGNHPIWRTLGNVYQIAIGQAVTSFLIYPHHRQGESPNSVNGCIAGTDRAYNYSEPGGRLINDGASRDWTSASVGCGAVFDWAGSSRGQQFGNVNGTPAARPFPTDLAAYCSTLSQNIGTCYSSTAVGSIAAGTKGFLNNSSNLCIPGVYCAFDCTADGGLTIDVQNLAVRYTAPSGFEVKNQVTYRGPLAQCRENLRATYEESLEEFAPCAGESNCYYYVGGSS